VSALQVVQKAMALADVVVVDMVVIMAKCQALLLKAPVLQHGPNANVTPG
jgi:hypothetical protein